MTILAIEFSSSRRSVALAADGVILAEAVEANGGRGTGAFGLIERALAAAKISREAIEVIAVGLGPGSYTGIRAGIALAQGWQLARGVKLLGMNSMESLAAQAQAEGIYCRVNVVVDAQRDEFYLAEWEITPTARQPLRPLRLAPAAEIVSKTSAGEVCVGPEMLPPLFPRASAGAAQAAQRTDFVSGSELEPIYLRQTSFVKAPAGRLVL